MIFFETLLLALSSMKQSSFNLVVALEELTYQVTSTYMWINRIAFSHIRSLGTKQQWTERKDTVMEANMKENILLLDFPRTFYQK